MNRRAALRRSLDNPHPSTAALADESLQDWSDNLPQEAAEALVDFNAGTAVTWIPDRGWIEASE